MRKNIIKIINTVFLFIVLLFCFFIIEDTNKKYDIKNAIMAENYNNSRQNKEKTSKLDYEKPNNSDISSKHNFNLDLKVLCNNKEFYINNYSKDLIINEKIGKLSINDKIKIMDFAIKNGFSIRESINFTFPEVKECIEYLEKETFISPKEVGLYSVKNTGNINIDFCKNGRVIDKNKLYNDIFYNLTNKTNNKAIRAVFKKIDPKIKFSADDIVLKGSHKIDFKNSSESRKNNIKTALKALDGIVIMPNQTISFNEITGERNETNGYMKAKTIKNGTFIPEFGGGVCQVSTTLYNAAILSGLDIIEVNPHSLPVSYEKPCFDAMVNMGSSDLKIKNNTELPIIIATSDKNDSCLINIYGVKNKYLIVRKSEIINDFIQFQKIKTKNYKEYGYNEPLKKNEEILISKGKKGYRAVGILEYYKDGVLIKTEKIRDNIYNPTKEVLLVGDN